MLTKIVMPTLRGTACSGATGAWIDRLSKPKKAKSAAGASS